MTEYEETTGDDIPTCGCGRLKDVQSMTGVWRCTRCDRDELRERWKVTRYWRQSRHEIVSRTT